MLMKRWTWTLAPLSGALLALGFPGLGPDLLAWFALIPLFFALEERSYKAAFGRGLLGGMAFFGVLLHWLWTLREWTGPAIFPLYLLLILYLGLYWGAFALGYEFFKRRLGPLGLALAVPAIWVILEFARVSGRFGFAWGDLGYALYRRVELIQLASLTGALGLSFVIVWINYLLFLALRGRDWRALLGAILIFAFLFGYGAAVMRHQLKGRELRVALIQPNLPQERKSDPRNLEEFLRVYLTLLGKVDPAGAELVILPETILPAYLLQQAEYLEPFSRFAQEKGLYLLFGTLDFRQGRFYNTAALLSPQGEPIAQYDKVQLVPFSPEYLPLRAQLERLGFAWLVREVAPVDLTPGQGFFPLESSLGKIATPICFESSFSHISRGFVRNGAELLVTLTNDAWFKRSAALVQHFAFGAVRAVETRRYFIQAANTGISGIISPKGVIVHSLGVETEEVLYGRVELLSGRTFYTRFGDWLAYLCLICLLVALIASGFTQRVNEGVWVHPGAVIPKSRRKSR
ncbi:MAG: apolipoprotein N-acyltransferase [Candidatus Bipolaricaulia bacterium]